MYIIHYIYVTVRCAFLMQELYPSSMVLDQFVEIHQCIVPEEWDRFVRMVYRQFVEVGIYT